ncbi:MAG TPA: PaaI family thioesterase [Burkholderiaceae bacterium]|nr:PaaI family thioesterase [Burkholderiaceae bacterium]
MKLRTGVTAETLRARAQIGLPQLVGLQVVELRENALVMRLPIRAEVLAPNGYLHAASVIALADTCCGFACAAHLPQGASNFTTIELKSNFLGTATEGTLEAEAVAVHLGRTTHVWDAPVRHIESQRTIALFRCTQMVLWPK